MVIITHKSFSIQVHEKYWPLKAWKGQNDAARVRVPKAEGSTLNIIRRTLSFFCLNLSTYDPTITDSLRVCNSDVPFHGLHYSSVTCGALHPAECSGHSGQHPLPPLPGPTSEHSQNTHTAGWPSPCPQQALSNGTEEMSSPYSVPTQSPTPCLNRTLQTAATALHLITEAWRHIAFTGYHRDSLHNLLKINLKL